MLEPKSLSLKLHIPLIVIFLLGLGVIVFVTYQGMQSVTQNVYKKEIKPLQAYLQKSIQATKDAGISNALLLANDKMLKEAIMMDNQSKISKILEKSASAVTKNTDTQYLQIEYIADKKIDNPVSVIEQTKQGPVIKSMVTQSDIFGDSVGVLAVEQRFDRITADLQQDMGGAAALLESRLEAAATPLAKQVQALSFDTHADFGLSRDYLVTQYGPNDGIGFKRGTGYKQTG